MGKLIMCKNGNYENENAVPNVIHYITRTRKNEQRVSDLIGYGGAGIGYYYGPDKMIQQFLYVQNNRCEGRRIYHEVFSILDEEYRQLGNDNNLIWQFALACCNAYYQLGHQVVFAIHWELEKRLHIHFAVNTINFVDGRKWHSSNDDLLERERGFNHILNQYKEAAIESRKVTSVMYYGKRDNTKKYYVVCEGRKRGIFDSWDQCEAQVSNFKGNQYKKFDSLDSALVYIGQEMPGGEEYIIMLNGRISEYGDYNAFVEALERMNQ